MSVCCVEGSQSAVEQSGARCGRRSSGDVVRTAIRETQ